MSVTPNEKEATAVATELPHTDSLSYTEKDGKSDDIDGKQTVDVESLSVTDEDVGSPIIQKDEDVAVEVSF